MQIPSLVKIHWYPLKLSRNENMDVSKADKIDEICPSAINTNAHTKFGENPLTLLKSGPDKSIARPPGTSPKSRWASLFRLYDARSGKCQKIARTVKSASIYGKKVWSKDVNKYW